MVLQWRQVLIWFGAQLRENQDLPQMLNVHCRSQNNNLVSHQTHCSVTTLSSWGTNIVGLAPWANFWDFMSLHSGKCIYKVKFLLNIYQLLSISPLHFLIWTKNGKDPTDLSYWRNGLFLDQTFYVFVNKVVIKICLLFNNKPFITWKYNQSIWTWCGDIILFKLIEKHFNNIFSFQWDTLT